MKAITETSQKASIDSSYAPFYLHLSLCLCPPLQAELGVNEHHQNEVVSYMRFARFKRGMCLKTVDSCFQDLKDSMMWGGGEPLDMTVQDRHRAVLSPCCDWPDLRSPLWKL